MNIGIEGSILRGRRTGINNYSYNILLELFKADPGLRLLSAGWRGWEEVNLYGQSPQSNRSIQLTLLDAAKSKLRYLPGQSALRRTVAENVFRLTNSPKTISLFHAFGYIPPFNVSAPVLPVVYDLSFVRYPEMHPKERVRRLSVLPRVIEQSPLIHTISEFSKREIVDVFGYPQERIFVAYPAAADVFCSVGEDESKIDLSQFSLVWDHYLLAVGTLEPRKNLRTLVLAYSHLPASVRKRFPLVIVGGKGWGETAFPASISQLISDGSVRFVGFVPDPVLRSLYEGARLMLYPSVYEGFGMPVVEALACGAPVAHSSNTSMDEITDDGSIRIPALDVDGWANCMKELTSLDHGSTEAARQQRRERAAKFSWAESAKVVRSAYDQIAASQ